MRIAARVRRTVLAASVTLVVASGCSIWRPAAVTEPAQAFRSPRRSVPLHDDSDIGSLRAAIAESVAWFERQPADRAFVVGPRRVSAGEQARALGSLGAFLADGPTSAQLAAYLRERFDVLVSVGGPDGAMLVTGYYEPVVDVSDRPDAEYRTPVLGLPGDLVEARLGEFSPRLEGERIVGRLEGRRLVPYWDRGQIEGGRLNGRGLELAWARNPVDVFFMEIQGSGTLRFPDGREQRVGYAGANGRPYRSIGRLLIDEGRLSREAVSMQSIRAWLAGHAAEQQRVLQHNAAYVFFRALPGPPEGSLGRPVTPGRSIATDARLFPAGGLAFIETERPVRDGDGHVRWEPLRRLVLNQDTGGAIRGPGRVDLFWGRGQEAELAAGLMKQPGQLYFLVPKENR